MNYTNILESAFLRIHWVRWICSEYNQLIMKPGSNILHYIELYKNEWPKSLTENIDCIVSKQDNWSKYFFFADKLQTQLRFCKPNWKLESIWTTKNKMYWIHNTFNIIIIWMIIYCWCGVYIIHWLSKFFFKKKKIPTTLIQGYIIAESKSKSKKKILRNFQK